MMFSNDKLHLPNAGWIESALETKTLTFLIFERFLLQTWNRRSLGISVCRRLEGRSVTRRHFTLTSEPLLPSILRPHIIQRKAKTLMITDTTHSHFLCALFPPPLHFATGCSVTVGGEASPLWPTSLSRRESIPSFTFSYLE